MEKVLVANRGEIARRIFRTCSDLDIATVAVYSDADSDAPFAGEATESYRLGPADAALSYLSPTAVLAAADATGATAVHPGYGFLSENAGFAESVIAAGLVWVGPNPAVMAAMASKVEARRLAEAAGVPVIPGFHGSQDETALSGAAADIGYPVLIKASQGGGGKGIRVVHEAGRFAAALAQAQAEAGRAFGDDTMLVERYIGRPRHIEVQVVGDHHGNVIHLGTRECSAQRRYQKLLEEAPAPRLGDTTRRRLETAAVDLAAAVGYDSVGTVEFVVDGSTDDFYFLEMNTRIQVEHPVTEMVTGVDLVELQLRVAAGEPLPLAQQDVVFCGHAFEARINAEAAEAGFIPQTGVVAGLRVPTADGLRWDSAVEAGSSISPYYDSMIAKLIAFGADREAARRTLAEALDELLIAGLPTTAGFHRWLIEQPEVVHSTITTDHLDGADIPPPPAAPVGLAAAVWQGAQAARRPVGAWGRLRGFRTTGLAANTPVLLQAGDGEVCEAVPSPDVVFDGGHVEGASGGRRAALVDAERGIVAVNVQGHTFTFGVLSRSEHWTSPAGGGAAGQWGDIVAPFPAVVSEILVAEGDELVPGDPVLVIEAMKMLHTLQSPRSAVVTRVNVAEGDQVDSGQVLVGLAEPVSAQDA